MIQNKKIILSPLDWGLGHTTRCIPLIRSLLAHHNEVWLAGNHVAKNLFQEEFPELPFLDLPGYDIQYASSAKRLPWKLSKQLPKLYKAVRMEHCWLAEAIQTYQFNYVISDNRFGFYAKNTPSVFITHQLNIQAPNVWLHRMANFLNHHYLEQFDACWVPDYADARLSGTLSSYSGTQRVAFIGPLSRFKKPSLMPSKDIDILVVLSGPEPQRSLLEQKLLNELDAIPGSKVLVRGLPTNQSELIHDSFTIHNHVSSDILENLLLRSTLVISRAGYSSIMDYDALGCSALLIPTPGQTEQAYLAQHLSKQKQFFFATQETPLFPVVQEILSLVTDEQNKSI